MLLHKTLGKIVYPSFKNLVWRLPRRQNTVYLTFDDGPSPDVTDQILKILAEFDAPATFFLSGKMISEFQGTPGKLNYRNHIIGNHAYSHDPLIFSSAGNITEEIRSTDRLISEAWGQASRLFRPPFGIFGPAVNRVLSQMGKDLILWSLMSYDFKWNAEKVLQHLRSNLHTGDIVVFHDSLKSAETTLSVLPEFLNYCRDNKFEFLTLR